MQFKNPRAWFGRFAMALLLAVGMPTAFAAPAPLPADEVAEIATEAYIYAYPLVLMEITRKVSTSGIGGKNNMHASMNQFAHAGVFPDDKFETVVRPNADTLYSSLWYDVGKEPLLITVPDSGGRYYLLPLMDMWTDIFTSPGKRTTGTGPQTWAIVGPNWKGKLPAGVTAYRSPTAIGWMIGRTQTNGAADFAAVRAFQAGIKTTPLSAWGKPGYVPAATKPNADQDTSAPVEQVTRMDAAKFFALFAQLTQNSPPHANDYPILDRMARIGLVPGKNFDLNALAPDVRDALMAAPPIAQKKILLAGRSASGIKNGWRTMLNPIGSYGTDYLRRAMVAYFGLGANVIEDATYPSAFTDSDGKPFDSGAKYVMHFDKEQLPPVRAFWSLTMYNDRQFFTANSINRFAIGDRDALKFNADGSLDLYIQREAPDADKMSNWLPAPSAGGFTMNMRLYWPRPAALEGSWTPPPVKRLN